MNNAIQLKAADAFVAAHGYSASVVRLRNTSDVSIDYSVSGGDAVELAAGASAVVDVAALTSEISVRRTDLSTTPVNVMLEFGLDPDEAYVFAVDVMQTAHGFGVYTVAQLNAFTNANRPTVPVDCSDCISPHGYGAKVCWDALSSAWRIVDCGILATTDFAAFFADYLARPQFDELATDRCLLASGVLSNGWTAMSTANGASFSASASTATGALMRTAVTGTNATGSIRSSISRVAQYLTDRKPVMAIGLRQLWYSSTTGVTSMLGFSNANEGTLASNFFGLALDPGNVLGGLNPELSENVLFVNRDSNVNRAETAPLSVAFPKTAATAVDVIVLIAGDTLSAYIGGAKVGECAIANQDQSYLTHTFANDGTNTTARALRCARLMLGVWLPNETQ